MRAATRLLPWAVDAFTSSVAAPDVSVRVFRNGVPLFRTTTVGDSFTPAWPDAYAPGPITIGETDQVELQAFDSDALDADDQIGVCTTQGMPFVDDHGYASARTFRCLGQLWAVAMRVVPVSDALGSMSQPVPSAAVAGNVRRGSASVGTGDSTGGAGDLESTRVAAVLNTNIVGIRECYERALARDASLAGRLEVRFTIGPSGRVAARPSTSGLAASPDVGACVASRVQSLVFPAPRGGSVDFSFPFNFTPGG